MREAYFSNHCIFATMQEKIGKNTKNTVLKNEKWCIFPTILSFARAQKQARGKSSDLQTNEPAISHRIGSRHTCTSTVVERIIYLNNYDILAFSV